jgi:hypothetical protein
LFVPLTSSPPWPCADLTRELDAAADRNVEMEDAQLSQAIEASLASQDGHRPDAEVESNSADGSGADGSGPSTPLGGPASSMSNSKRVTGTKRGRHEDDAQTEARKKPKTGVRKQARARSHSVFQRAQLIPSWRVVLCFAEASLRELRQEKVRHTQQASSTRVGRAADKAP